jgi:hypothetical protein
MVALYPERQLNKTSNKVFQKSTEPISKMMGNHEWTDLGRMELMILEMFDNEDINAKQMLIRFTDELLDFLTKSRPFSRKATFCWASSQD